MKCPFCCDNTAEVWIPLLNNHDSDRQNIGKSSHCLYMGSQLLPPNRRRYIQVEWMQCQSPDCEELIVRVTRRDVDNSKQWFAVPRKTVPTIDPLVPENYARDYNEAWMILDDSYRMSATLSRKVLADLLADFGGLKNRNLTDAVNAFIEDRSHPKRIQENLHHLRVMGNLGAHTKKDSDGQILEIDKDEAEWSLKVVSDLFDYFIIGPVKDSEQRTAFNKKLKDAGKDPIKPLSED